MMLFHTTRRQARFGTIIQATLRPEDTIPAFLGELRRLRGRVPRELWLSAQACLRNASTMDENGLEVSNDLINDLNNYAPPYAYFGASPGDGADFGFWLNDDWQLNFRDNGGLQVADTSEVPADYVGEVLHVNDHGNVALYNANKGALTEVWSLV